MNKKHYDKPKYAIIVSITALSLMAVLGVLWLVMAFAAPYSFASFTYKLGLNSYAHTLYLRDYNRTNNINSIYMANNLSIKLKNYTNIISDYEALESHTNYYALVDKVNKDNMNLNIDKLAKSTLINEDEYLKNNYVLALINTDRWEQAITLAKTQIDGFIPSLDNLGNYLFGNLVNATNESREELIDVVEDINTYFNALTNVLDDCNFATDNEIYLIALCNKMIKVGNNLIVICTDYSVDGIVTNVQAKLQDVNSALSTLYGE